MDVSWQALRACAGPIFVVRLSGLRAPLRSPLRRFGGPRGLHDPPSHNALVTVSPRRWLHRFLAVRSIGITKSGDKPPAPRPTNGRMTCRQYSPTRNYLLALLALVFIAVIGSAAAAAPNPNPGAPQNSSAPAVSGNPV